ncbi:MAG: hypothetical protein HFI38_00940 [Lachnospiraceae bacterium]|jgi:hypothetical protein|nr:hypothetical protein [Lachnospiraceae bacterium]
MRKNHGTGKRLRLIPLILGGYGAFLGFGLMVVGLAEIKEGIGITRLLIGFGMAGFGLLGIWDGVRDLVRPDKKPEQAPARQFILTDTSGNRSSLVTPELLRGQMDILTESEEYKSFYLQILPPLPVKEYGVLKQIICVYQAHLILAAFFEMPKDGYRIYQKSTEPDMAEEWLKQLLAGSPDFSQWENVKTNPRQEGEEPFWPQLLTGQKGQTAHWHQLLVIFGESWHDEHKFFSVRDVELAIEGIHEGKYRKVVLEWGTQAFDLFPGVQNELLAVWCTDNTGRGDPRFLAREGTMTQVKFWLVKYLHQGFLEEMSGWADITAQIEKEKRRREKKHGKVF